MPEQIAWAFSLQVLYGPKLMGSGTLDVAVYDKTTVTLAAGDTDVAVDVLPGESDALTLLAITANQYGQPAEAKRLSYKQDPAATTGITLDAPLILIGAGALGFLPEPVQTLHFTNGTDNAAVIEILVGRNG